MLLGGCSQSENRTYSVPKEKVAAAQPQIHWVAPAGWTEQPVAGMRVGSFAVAGQDDQKADVSVIPLSGAAGSDLENVNRWRAQVGLAPLTAEKLAESKEKAVIGGAEGSLFEMAGSSPETGKQARLIGAILAKGETTWFFKILGSDVLVTEQKPAFQQFLKSVSFAEAPAPTHVHSAEPAGATPPNSGLPPTADANPMLPKWEVPAGWRPQTPGTMLLARFSLGDPASGKADLTVSAFPGDVGGLTANINRWRSQLGLGLLEAADVPKVTSPLEVSGEKVTLVEMTNGKPGAAQPANRILVAILQRDGQTWFFKLLGDDGLVTREKPAFLKFVQSIRFPHA